MEKTIKLGKLALAVACIAALMASSVTVCFAAESDVPVNMNMATTELSFTISESIEMSGDGSSTDLTVTDLEITNDGTVGVINIDYIELEAKNGWTLAASDTEWSKLAADAKTFGITADGIHDFSNGAYANVGTVNPETTKNIEFTGQTGMITTAITDENVANMVVTLSFVTSGAE